MSEPTKTCDQEPCRGCVTCVPEAKEVLRGDSTESWEQERDIAEALKDAEAMGWAGSIQAVEEQWCKADNLNQQEAVDAIRFAAKERGIEV